MRLATFLSLALSWHSAVQACGGHGQELKHWSQEELDELERKWGIEVYSDEMECNASLAHHVTSGDLPASGPLHT